MRPKNAMFYRVVNPAQRYPECPLATDAAIESCALKRFLNYTLQRALEIIRSGRDEQRLFSEVEVFKRQLLIRVQMRDD